MSWEIINGDCLAELPKLAARGVTFDAFVTDPPYKDYQTNRYDAAAWHAPVKRIPPAEYAPLMFRVLREGGAAVVWLTWDVFEEHRRAFEVAGFEVRNQIVWAKPNHTAGDLDGNLGNQYEVALFAVKGGWKRHDKRETNLWTEPHLFSRDFRHHPTEKPLSLMRRAVRLACPPDGLVLDPFAGSFTTGCAAIAEGRNFVGIELLPGYCAIGEARMRRASGEPVAIPRAHQSQRVGPLFEVTQ